MPKQLSAASIKNLERQVGTINQWPEFEITTFLEDHEDKALEMALTLKHYANPLGGYPRDPDAVAAMQNVFDCLTDPVKLEQQSKEKLTEDEAEYLVGLLRAKLDKLANDIIDNKKITSEAIRAALEKANPPPAPPTGARHFTAEEQEERRLEAWWNNLTPAQQKEIEKRNQKLNKAQQQHLQQRVHYHYHYYPRRNLYYYNQMSLIDAELDFLLLNSMLRTQTSLLNSFLYYNSFNYPRMHIRGGDLFYHGARLIPAGPSHGGASRGLFSGGGGRPSGGSSGSGKDDASIFLIIAAIAAFVAFAIAALGASIYAIKKVANSIKNIFTGNKVIRSLYRLGTIAGSAAVGAYLGSMVGAVLGSIIPGLGTAAGAILGGILGAGVGAGVGAIIAKYSAKAVSSFVYRNELNPSNPEKWRLTKKQKAFFFANNVPVEEVEAEIVKIKEEKSKIGPEGSFFWTEARAKKTEWNKKLKDLKDGVRVVKREIAPDCMYPPLNGFFSAPQPSAPPMDQDYYKQDTRPGFGW